MEITEVEQKEFMSKKEQALKKRLIALLKDDGKGHYHAKYAERLIDFDVKIVPLGQEPSTAAISFDTGVIYINEGFLTDPNTFFQLNVLLRHEMAHNLLMHQIRMMHHIEKKYGKEGESRIRLSQTLHSLNNVIEDFEISNKRYSEADKHTVRNMYLNGQLIGGLVTEDHRQDWSNMSVTDMYDKLSEETEKIQQEILNSWASGNPGFNSGTDFIRQEIGGTYYYAQIDRPADFSGPAAAFMQNKALYHFFPFDQVSRGQVRPCVVKLSSLPPEWQTLLKAVFNTFTAQGITAKHIDEVINKIAKSSPTTVVNVEDPLSSEIIEKVYTPEEKLLVSDILKAIKPTLMDYQTWYDKIKNVLGNGNYSQQDLTNILNSLK